MRQIEWEFVWQNYHFIPPIFQEYFEEIAATKHIEDFEEFERAWYSAICVIQDQHEEDFMARKKLSEEEVRNTQQKRVRFAELVRCHQVASTHKEKLVEVTLEVGEMVVSKEISEEVLPVSELSHCAPAPEVASSEVPQESVEPEVDDQFHFGGEPLPATVSSVPQEVSELQVDDQFHFGGVLIPAATSNVP